MYALFSRRVKWGLGRVDLQDVVLTTMALTVATAVRPQSPFRFFSFSASRAWPGQLPPGHRDPGHLRLQYQNTQNYWHTPSAEIADLGAISLLGALLAGPRSRPGTPHASVQ